MDVGLPRWVFYFVMILVVIHIGAVVYWIRKALERPVSGFGPKKLS